MTGPASTATAVTDEKLDLTGTAPELAEPEVEPPVPQAEPEVPSKRKMKRSTRRAVAIIVVIAVLAALGFGGAYVLYSRNFVSTDNAQVDGNKIEINAPVSGVLVDWQGTQGNSVTRNQAIGRVEIGSSSGGRCRSTPRRTGRSRSTTPSTENGSPPAPTWPLPTT
ncbi:MAG TPA: hypothetical protein VGP04_18500 [Pseudonocardiaceae bacterium]|nr:hypothetical protein [Pseudonocardiaceae bacterium]